MKLGKKILLAASVLSASPLWLVGAAVSQPWNGYAGYGYNYGPSYYGYGPAYSTGYYSPVYGYDYGAVPDYPYLQNCGYLGGPKTGAWTCFR